MEITAKARYIKISPKKVRLVLDVIRGMEVGEALDQLKFLNKRATEPVMKLLKSAIANARNNFGLEKSNLTIKEIMADDGPTLKRWKPRAHGRATPIRKRMTHISLVLEEKVPSGVKKKTQEVEAPISAEEMSKREQEEKETRNKKRETRDDAKILKMTETGELREKRKDGGLDELRKKQEKRGFLRKMFSRKTG